MSVDGVVTMMRCLSAESMQVGPLGQRRRQELISGQEQHRELGAVFELLPVALLAKLAHAFFHLLRVTAQRGSARFVVLRFRGIHVGIERSLGVDHDAARIGHAYQQVGAQRAACRRC